MKKKILIVLGILIPVFLICFIVFTILATLGYIGVQTTQKKYRDTVRLNDVRSFTNSLEEYFAKYGTYPKLSDTALLTNIETVKEKKDISLSSSSVSFLNPNSGANTEYSFILTAPGLKIYTGTGNIKTINCESGDKSEGNTLRASTNTWQIFYRTNGNAPQRYTLLTCTEEGWVSTYLGANTD